MLRRGGFTWLILLLLAAPIEAHAFNNIIRPYFSPRTGALGGCRITTGLYDENFFGNPARAAENPEARFQLLDLQLETSANTLSTITKLIKGESADFSNLAKEGAGITHARIQTAFPAYYNPSVLRGKYAVAVGLFTSTQIEAERTSGTTAQTQAVTDIGPAVTVAGRFLEGERLTLGATGHLTYRVSAGQGYSILDMVSGKSPSLAGGVADGTHLDVDLGASYVMPWQPNGWRFTPSITVNQLWGGTYRNIDAVLLGTVPYPIPQPRTYGVGISFRRDELWILDDVIFAYEFTDIGNNGNGSTVLRLLHAGGEGRLGILIPRIGVNQGYLSGGLGLDLKLLEVDFATYGEEMSRDAWGVQNRRYALRVAIHI